jgi:hypothetical protein
MNLRDLWDNVVLRDVLGYIVPGIVTMFAIALLVGGITGTTLPGWVTKAATTAGLSFLDTEGWRSWRRWMAASLVVPLAYAIGHLQIWIIECLEEKVPCWNNGKLALDFLSNECMGDDYARAGLRLSKLREISSFAQEPLIQDLRDSTKRLRDRQACVLSLLCDKQRESAKKGTEAERQAKEVWRLCDRYVLRKDRDIHSMFMGRYYILAAFFTNLGLSLIALAVSALLVYLTEYPLEALFGAAASLPCGLSPLWWPVPGASLLLLGIGVLMIMRSSYFRKRFVECTFPIFYAIVQAEEKSEAGQA